METDLRRPGLKAGSFDVVYSSGVLHHTPDPRASFARLVQLARPGGTIVLGVYNAFARIPLRLRRLVARLSGFRLIPFDPVLRDRANEPARREAWLRDQYQHPEEHRHTLAEVQGWFAENRVEYLAGVPERGTGRGTGASCSRARPTTGGPRAGWRNWAGFARSDTRAGCSSRSAGARRTRVRYTVFLSSACRLGQINSAIARAPSRFGCARSLCISEGLLMMFTSRNGTSGTRNRIARSSYSR